MVNNITFNNVTYDLDTLGPKTYSNKVASSTGGQDLEFYIAIIQSGIADAGRVLKTTSVTSLTIGTGSQAFVTAVTLPFTQGSYVMLSDTAAPTTNQMTGIVTAVNDANVTINVQSANDIVGSGTIPSWHVAGVGKPGVQGISGSFDIDGLTSEDNISPDDTAGFYDVSAATNRKMAIANLAITVSIYNDMFL